MPDKAATRAIATRLGLLVAEKPDSQDICFVPDGDYARTVRSLAPDAVRPGEIVDLEGRVLGRHEGVIHFTVGQRRGLGLSGRPEPLFVVALDAARAVVTVGPREAIRIQNIELSDVNWLITPPGDAGSEIECLVKVRSMRPPVPARVTAREGCGALVELPAGEEAVAPGQACVFYETAGSRVLGGGWIRSAAALRAVA
jgi:tRNA-specific 2-thiouridylase